MQETSKRKVDTWMPLYVADYLAATSHLCAAEHGAYLLLIMHAWMHDGYLPKDDKRLCRVARMSPDEWANSKEALLEFFIEREDGYTHTRVDEELDRAKSNREQKSVAGKASAAQRALQRESNERSTDVATERSTEFQRDGQRKPNSSPLPLPTTSPEPNGSVGTLVVVGESKTVTPTKPTLSPEVSTTRETWAAYSAAYEARHGEAPIRNASVNGKLAQFLKRVPADEAPHIAAFYVRSNKSIYVRDKHPVGWLLSHAETLRTEWATGRQGTESEARQADQTQGRGNVFQELIEEAKHAAAS